MGAGASKTVSGVFTQSLRLSSRQGSQMARLISGGARLAIAAILARDAITAHCYHEKCIPPWTFRAVLGSAAEGRKPGACALVTTAAPWLMTSMVFRSMRYSS